MSRKSSKVDRAWLHDHLTDPYVRQAQREGYRARAAYKLQELDKQFGLVRPGARVVDLGAAPGAWSQYLARKLAGSGSIVAVDLLPMEPIDGVEILDVRWFSREDIRERAGDTLLLPGRTSIARAIIEEWYGGPLDLP